MASARQEYEKYLMRTAKFTVRELLDMAEHSTFQRPLSRLYVRDIVRRWDINLWEMPVVGQLPDGTHVLNEGQHRVNAAAIVFGEDAEIECRVIETSNPGHLFAELNTAKKHVQALDIFLAESDNPDSLPAKVTQLAKSHGFEIDRGQAAYAIKSVASFVKAYEADADALAKTLQIIHEVIRARDNERGWTRGNVIATIFTFIRLVKCDHKDLAKRLARGNSSVAVPHGMNELTENLISVGKIYNKGRTADKRVDILEAIQKERGDS
jgi:hypothetical protein